MSNKNKLAVRENVELTTSSSLGLMVDRFLLAQDVKPSSRALYRRTLKQYLSWVEEQSLPLSQINRVHIIAYKEDLIKKGMSGLSIGSYLTVVRKFYEWAEASKLYPNVAKGIKTPRRKREFKKQSLTPEQATKLLAYFHEKGLRDYAIINLLLRTGLRTIELVNANIEDITFRRGKRILMVQGKGEVEKNAFVVLTDKAHLPIQEYLSTKQNPLAKEPLFTSISNNNNGRRLTTRSISQIVKEGLKAIGLDSKHLTAHSLRHTTAVSILRAGGSLTDAQGVLRHATPTTTQIYTASIDEEMRIKRAPEELVEGLF